jgi:hypothetical protein
MQTAEQLTAVIPSADSAFVPLRFRAAADFQTRPAFQSDLDHGQRKLLKIIGDYEFNETQKLKCGLKRCRTTHWHGYVVLTDDGIETNIGRDCGKKYFGVNWGEVRTVFDRAREEQNWNAWIDNLASSQKGLSARAEAIYSELQPLGNALNEVLAKINREDSVGRAFRAMVSAGGAIQVEREVAADVAKARGLPMSQRRYLETVARVQGLDALGLGPQLRDLATVAIPLFASLTPKYLAGLDKSQRRDRSKAVDDAMALMDTCEARLVSARAFLDPGNLRLLAKLPAIRPNERAQRILRQFANL